MKPFGNNNETILKPTNCRKAKAITVRLSESKSVYTFT